MKIEADDKTVILIFERPCDNVSIYYKEAYRVGDILEKEGKIGLITPQPIRLNQKNGYVYLFFPWADRLILSLEQSRILGLAIKKKAQDAELTRKNIFLR